MTKHPSVTPYICALVGSAIFGSCQVTVGSVCACDGQEECGRKSKQGRGVVTMYRIGPVILSFVLSLPSQSHIPSAVSQINKFLFFYVYNCRYMFDVFP